MKLFRWLRIKKDIGTESAEYFVDMAQEAQRKAHDAAEERQRQSIERDLLYINGLMRHVDGPSS